MPIVTVDNTDLIFRPVGRSIDQSGLLVGRLTSLGRRPTFQTRLLSNNDSSQVH